MIDDELVEARREARRAIAGDFSPPQEQNAFNAGGVVWPDAVFAPTGAEVTLELLKGFSNSVTVVFSSAAHREVVMQNWAKRKE